MWDAMAAPCEACRSREALGRANKRIILTIDGENATMDDQVSVRREVLDSRVLIDAIIRPNSDEETDQMCLVSLLSFALHSGADRVCPKTVDEAIETIQRESSLARRYAAARSPKKCQADRQR
jgi:hypothetical protein